MRLALILNPLGSRFLSNKTSKLSPHQRAKVILTEIPPEALWVLYGKHSNDALLNAWDFLSEIEGKKHNLLISLFKLHVCLKVTENALIEDDENKNLLLIYGGLKESSVTLNKCIKMMMAPTTFLEPPNGQGNQKKQENPEESDNNDTADPSQRLGPVK